MREFEGRIGAGAIGRGLGPLAALTLVAVLDGVCLEWEWGGSQAAARLLGLGIGVGRATLGL